MEAQMKNNPLKQERLGKNKYNLHLQIQQFKNCSNNGWVQDEGNKNGHIMIKLQG